MNNILNITESSPIFLLNEVSHMSATGIGRFDLVIEKWDLATLSFGILTRGQWITGAKQLL